MNPSPFLVVFDCCPDSWGTRGQRASVQLVADSLVAVQEVKEHYAEKVGIDDLNRLEDGLRDVVRRLDLEYLPESWTDGQ